MRSVANKKLKPGMVLALPFGKTATITEVKIGRQYVTFKTEHGKSRVGVHGDSMIEEAP